MVINLAETARISIRPDGKLVISDDSLEPSVVIVMPFDLGISLGKYVEQEIIGESYDLEHLVHGEALLEQLILAADKALGRGSFQTF